jgi:hypothetical protein
VPISRKNIKTINIINNESNDELINESNDEVSASSIQETNPLTQVRYVNTSFRPHVIRSTSNPSATITKPRFTFNSTNISLNRFTTLYSLGANFAFMPIGLYNINCDNKNNINKDYINDWLINIRRFCNDNNCVPFWNNKLSRQVSDG